MKTHTMLWSSIHGISRGGGKMSEKEKVVFLCILLAVGLLLVLWGVIVVIRYSNVKTRVRRKMKWSNNQDPFWEYERIVRMAKDAYLKAQIGLTGNTPHINARIRQLKRRVIRPEDIEFVDAYVVSFYDISMDIEDKVKVLFEIRNKNYPVRYKEIASFRRTGESLLLTGIVKNPTIYMIAHAISIIEK